MQVSMVRLADPTEQRSVQRVPVGRSTDKDTSERRHLGKLGLQIGERTENERVLQHDRRRSQVEARLPEHVTEEAGEHIVERSWKESQRVDDVVAADQGKNSSWEVSVLTRRLAERLNRGGDPPTSGPSSEFG